VKIYEGLFNYSSFMKICYFKIVAIPAFLFVLLFVTPQCKKDKDEIPNSYVNFYIDINSTQYIGLNSIGGFIYVTGGVRGIIIYRKSVDEFMAYERDCPYKPSNTCALVQVDHSAIMAVDSCCGSKFLLLDGSVIKGPATRQLKQYSTSLDGTNLHVFN
jgi:nitrite reductase/ring-hydroxylating ferredoxin subunit